jgi:hypothetical protein
MFLKVIKSQKAELTNKININAFDKGIYFISVMKIINMFIEEV